MTPHRYSNGFLNFAHALDHLFMLIFPTAVLGMTGTFGLSYTELLPLAIGGFIAFGAGSIPAGWLGDHWSRYKMMLIFFFGTGLASIAVSLVQTPLQLATALTVLGAFAAIYHPVATAVLVVDPARVGRTLGVNGLFGNLGIAFSAFAAGALTELISWRAAFIVPGIVAIAAGVAYFLIVRDDRAASTTVKTSRPAIERAAMLRVFLIVLVSISCGGVIFQATTIAMPKLFDERLREFAATPLGIGTLVCGVYMIAAFAQAGVGPLIDRFAMRTVFVPIAVLQVPLLFLAGFAQGWAMLFAAVLMMLVVFGQIPVNDAMVARYTADSYRARAYAVRYLVSFGASAIALPLVALLRRLTGGFQEVFQVLAALALCTLVAALAFPQASRTRHKGSGENPIRTAAT